MSKLIKVNLISGFLGVGKTTLLQHLVENKFKDEKWAFLINEFGEVSIDHVVFENNDGLKISEIAGGCICCSASLPMQITMNRIIKEIQPDRIIIEPTGLGHPTNMIDLLRDASYRDHLQLINMITVVNPTHFVSKKHLENGTWHDQISLADVVIINKTDIAQTSDIQATEVFLDKIYPKKIAIQKTAFGKINMDILNLKAYEIKVDVLSNSHPKSSFKVDSKALSSKPTHGILKKQQSDDFGTYSSGWIFDDETNFDIQKLQTLFRSLPSIDRIKGVFKTPLGWFIIQKADDIVNLQGVAYRKDSRVEFISSYPENWEKIEQQLHETIWS